jgi:outer membrane receptor protein involved in Fe transport
MWFLVQPLRTLPINRLSLQLFLIKNLTLLVMKKLSLFFATSLLASCLLAQQPTFPMGNMQRGPSTVGKISGALLDSLTQTPLEFATVVLTDIKGKELDGVITDEKGAFRFQEVKTGAYQLQVSYIGYSSKTITPVTTTLEKPDLEIGKIFLLGEGIRLDEVEVVGQAAVVENKIDKLVYNAEKDITIGGDAGDVLRRVPLLSVDLDGNVTLRGSSNIQILINGKPSTLFSSNVADALKSIPAEQIKNVEVVTTPTAKYDGEGTAGIINIITKKKSVEGFTGSTNLSIGTRQNNANLNLNLTRGRFSLNGGLGAWFSWPRDGSFEFIRRDDINNVVLLEQRGASTNATFGPNGNIGASYDINAYNSISTSVSLRGFGNTRDNTISVFPLGQTAYDRINDSESFRGGFDWSTDYRKTFKQPEREFSMAVQVSANKNYQDDIILEEDANGLILRDALNANDGDNVETTLQLDYVHPFTPSIKLETGAKGVMRKIDSDFSFFDNLADAFDPNQTDVFHYDQDVYAGYASFNLKLGKNYGLVAGARYEHTRIAGNFEIDGNPFENDYENVLPSIIFSRTLKNFQSIKASYTRRIQRPSLRYVNPFTDVNDSRSVSTGNPYLLPELTDQFELTYSGFVKGIVLNTSVFYRTTTDIIEGFTVLDPNTNVSTTTFQNIGKNNSIGLNFFFSATIKKFWTLRGNFNVYTYDAESTTPGLTLSNSALLYGGNINSTFAFKKGWRVEMFGFFRANEQSLQGSNTSFSMFNMGVMKEFGKKLSVGVRVVEPLFRDKEFINELQGDGFYQRTVSTIAFRSYGISVNYRFGKLDFKEPAPRRRGVRNDDLKSEGENNF